MGMLTLLKLIPVFKMAIPLVIMLVAGTGVLAIGKGIRDNASVRAHYELATEINRSNKATDQSLHLVAERLRTERDRLRADDKLHRQEIDTLKQRLTIKRSDNLEGLVPCPPQNCLLDWSSAP